MNSAEYYEGSKQRWKLKSKQVYSWTDLFFGCYPKSIF